MLNALEYLLEYILFFDKIQNFYEKHISQHNVEICIGFFIIGVFGAEYIYFSTAEEVRLLFVLLIAPIGGIAGVLLILLIFSILTIFAAILNAALVIFILWLIIYTLYSIIVWTN